MHYSMDIRTGTAEHKINYKFDIISNNKFLLLTLANENNLREFKKNEQFTEQLCEMEKIKDQQELYDLLLQFFQDNKYTSFMLSWVYYTVN